MQCSHISSTFPGWVTVSFLGCYVPLSDSSIFQLHISAPRASTLRCRVIEQGYGAHAAFIYFQFLSSFITLTLPVTSQEDEEVLHKAGLNSRITVKTINPLNILQHGLKSVKQNVNMHDLITNMHVEGYD